jgi:Flp pilus assembly pilin Flp
MQNYYRTRLRGLIADCEGATAIEYGLILAFLGIAIMTALEGIGNEVATPFTRAGNALTVGNAAAA